MLDQFRREPEAPPSDSLAEATVLGALLSEPTLIGAVDLSGLLCFPDHRAMWAALRRTPSELRTDQMGFFYAWAKDLCRHHCLDLKPHGLFTLECRALLMWTSVTAARQAEPEWVEEQYERTRLDDPRRSVHYHDWRWWLVRLNRCAEARKIIIAAQEIADRAWRTPDTEFDVAGALRVLERHAPQPRRMADVVVDI